jgi:hypothetical protein
MTTPKSQDPVSQVDLNKFHKVQTKYAGEAKECPRPESAAQILPLNEANEDQLHFLLDDI